MTLIMTDLAMGLRVSLVVAANTLNISLKTCLEQLCFVCFFFKFGLETGSFPLQQARRLGGWWEPAQTETTITSRGYMHL